MWALELPSGECQLMGHHGVENSEQIRSGLMEYLERKRGQFARLFFLSNEELIDIFGKGTDLVESMLEEGSKGFITNLFEGIDSVRFHELS